MKITLYIVIALLVITAAASGYFISNLNGQINTLQTKLTSSINDLGTKIDTNDTRLEGEIQAGDTALKAADAALNTADMALSATITKIDTSLSQYAATADQKFSGITNDINNNAGKISQLGDTINNVGNSVLQTTGLYAQVKKSIVQITDGQNLIGSGFIMAGNAGAPTAATLKVVTAYHVIDDLNTIYITLDDGRSWKGKVWASSQEADIAILKFDPANTATLPDLSTLPALELADSLTVAAGDPVFVIGSPEGLSGTVTSGIVSHIRRAEIISGNPNTNLIQIDAAVNPGNSGGPLFNAKGKVIGVVVARIDPAEGDGISYAVASNMIKRVEKIIPNASESGPFKYAYPLLGVTTTDILPQDAAANNNTVINGAKVTNISGPAATGGVRIGDIITKIDSFVVNDSGDLSSFIAEYYGAGDTVTLTIMRGSAQVNVTVTLGTKP